MLQAIYFTPAQTGDTFAEFWDEFELVAQLDMELFDAMVNKAGSRLGLYNGPR